MSVTVGVGRPVLAIAASHRRRYDEDFATPRRNPFLFQTRDTSSALNAHDDIKHLVLTLLDGVGVPMASAMLTACFPDRFTVIDVRAIATLRAHGLVSPDTWPDYVDYVSTCRSIGDLVDRDLRTLDRALYTANGRAASSSSRIR